MSKLSEKPINVRIGLDFGIDSPTGWQAGGETLGISA
jgi:hypothetical protein